MGPRPGRVALHRVEHACIHFLRAGRAAALQEQRQQRRKDEAQRRRLEDDRVHVHAREILRNTLLVTGVGVGGQREISEWRCMLRMLRGAGCGKSRGGGKREKRRDLRLAIIIHNVKEFVCHLPQQVYHAITNIKNFELRGKRKRWVEKTKSGFHSDVMRKIIKFERSR